MLDSEENELSNIIIQVLIDSKKPMKLADILAEIAASKGQILGILKTLSDLEILRKQPISESDKSSFLYSLKSDITAIHVTKCSNYGIDLYSFGSFFKINNKQKKMALELSTQAEKVKTISSNNRKPLVHKHKLLNTFDIDDISNHLLLIYEASNNYLYEYLQKKSLQDSSLKELMDLHEHAEQSLKSYLEAHNKI